MLRGIGYLAARKNCEIPRAVLNEFSIKERDLFRLEMNENLRKLVEYFCESSKTELESSFELMRICTEKRKLKLLFLPRISLNHTLSNLKKSNFDVFDKKLFARSSLLPFRYKMNSIFLKP